MIAEARKPALFSISRRVRKEDRRERKDVNEIDNPTKAFLP